MRSTWWVVLFLLLVGAFERPWDTRGPVEESTGTVRAMDGGSGEPPPRPPGP